jgi:hypothetical protein
VTVKTGYSLAELIPARATDDAGVRGPTRSSRAPTAASRCRPTFARAGGARLRRARRGRLRLLSVELDPRQRAGARSDVALASPWRRSTGSASCRELRAAVSSRSVERLHAVLDAGFELADAHPVVPAAGDAAARSGMD